MMFATKDHQQHTTEHKQPVSVVCLGDFVMMGIIACVVTFDFAALALAFCAPNSTVLRSSCAVWPRRRASPVPCPLHAASGQSSTPFRR